MQSPRRLLIPLWPIFKRVVVGVYDDGFIHAGNLAYLSLLVLFPFFLLAASVASIFGQTQDGTEAVNAFLRAVPPNVEAVLRQPIHDVIHARTGSGIVWLGLGVAAWTSASLIETIRDILRRAYGTDSTEPFWRHRLLSFGIVFLSVLGTMISFSAQVAMEGVDQFIRRVVPFADNAAALISATRLVPLVVLCIALYGLFYSLTPRKYRAPHYPKWPGAVLTALWWYWTVLILPWALSHLSTYNMTYGSLAGVMITLIFFFVVGLGVVIGAELNAALAEMVARNQANDREKQEVDHA
ncbi:YihY/virulence factor BrkB family protein [Sphingobium fluviale]|uniref:YihY/virulence factor BrkB family protein n=1 Tax=Sphingobium fluviale TaxID=2506423 RepID=A0A4V1N3I0_9SPHN|nr:YihY/virulence factor BrkB family protein [Sphingobium fluviale]RXR28736.1 YihY/virulence factor BrkB family protein [Sphingobium fluviale]